MLLVQDGNTKAAPAQRPQPEFGALSRHAAATVPFSVESGFGVRLLKADENQVKTPSTSDVWTTVTDSSQRSCSSMTNARMTASRTPSSCGSTSRLRPGRTRGLNVSPLVCLDRARTVWPCKSCGGRWINHQH